MDSVKHFRWGGFVISLETAADWTTRITGLATNARQYGAMQKAIRAKVHPFKAEFRLVGDSQEELAYMVIMQAERLEHYKRDIPVAQFEEGEREAIARSLLEREGVTDYVFKTVHRGIAKLYD
ncbi:hypothetical protein AGABI1DRAFT_131409 [Agaricus bisporus var. burnettii JB137-S8]|uniref:Uncharacterized protein n=2 Tax=Agaricus bisporus var. burnettii TaxID=192524 RepID=K5WZP2_AGABU|nr:uncharacterized protein AGABI1DRAFT_131409 [Agaricus bisporus var. burnettii JB137-S8]EKM76318.1 hypothetical protein AGABI1DRAFT_131409 [Agaricus bisporus var. burnettii JB137-S8]